MFIENLSLFLNLRQKLFLILYLLNQLVLTFIEMISLSLVPIFIFYIQDLNSANLKIDEINRYLNLDILNLDINILIKYFFFSFVFLFFIKNFLLILANYFELYIIRDITRTNLIKLFKKFINQSFSTIIRKDYASFMRNLISEVAKSTGYIISYVSIIKETIMLIAIFIILMMNDYAISIFVLFFFLITSLIFLFYLKDILFQKGVQTLDAKSKVIDNIFNSLSVIKEMKIYKIENFFTKHLDINFSIKLKNDNYKIFVSKLPRNIFELLLIILFVSVILFSYYTKGNFETILPTLGLLVVASARILPSFTIIVQSFSSLIYSRPSFKNIANELEVKNDQTKSFKFDEKLVIKYNDFQKLSFQDLSFKYDKNFIFKDLNFSFRKNKITGIIGKTGKGKSTLLNIIIGLLKIENGSIILNENLKIAKNFKLDFSIGYVPQDTFLIDGTIAENIALGINKKKVDKNKIYEVIEFCELKDLVDNLEFGINTYVGQKGSLLSGGQRQRLNLARALYRSPELLILDESTNALDYYTKIKLIEKIKKNTSKFSVLCVTHDNDLLEYFDEVIKLN
jgi:ABC-type multidrug transport system fused ATPase/permease subunit